MKHFKPKFMYIKKLNEDIDHYYFGTISRYRYIKDVINAFSNRTVKTTEYPDGIKFGELKANRKLGSTIYYSDGVYEITGYNKQQH